jgi:tRNA threonylcarbamoyladenosine biosynthesis protein TsaE
MTFHIKHVDELLTAARKLLEHVKDHKVFLFYGEMGSGKTTFIKAICETLGVRDAMSSPTFSIVNEYSSPEGPVFHFDFYRLKNETEALDLGYEDYVYSGNYCFIEWPENIPNLLPVNAVKVNIKVSGDNERTVTIE